VALDSPVEDVESALAEAHDIGVFVVVRVDGTLALLDESMAAVILADS
jgi:hypothetical protein